MTSFTAHGVSAYVNGLCWSAKIPGPEGGEAEIEFFSGADREMRDVCLYLPLYGPIEILAIGVDDDASFEGPAPFAVDGPAIYYGTSITQGGCASRPGLSHQATVGRMLNVDYANFGFSGKGRCEQELAEALAEARASCFVLDVGQNTSVDMLRERFQTFVDVLREAQPETPLLATSPIFYNAALWSRGHREQVNEKREIIRKAIESRNEAGDARAHLLKAKDYHGGDVTDGAVDGGHPNDLGFARMAEGLRPVLTRILGVGTG
jgi:lysophospholipase L1-like esterase